MQYEVDYSAGHPTNLGAAKGAIRYVGTPASGKNLMPAEAAGLTANHYEILGVYEGTASWMLGGFAAGVAAARAVQADLARCGLPATVTVYFACDFQPIPGQIPACLAALDGAASVLGKANIGAYGFAAFVSAAIAGAHASFYWQCGSRSQLVPGVCLYQHNNDSTTVGGIAADIDEILLPNYGQTSLGGADLTPDESAKLDAIFVQITNKWGSWVPGAPATADFTLVDFCRAIDARLANWETGQLAELVKSVAALPTSATVDAATLDASVAAALKAAGWTAPPSATDVAAAVIEALRAAAASMTVPTAKGA